jgi:hypothetical protein
VENYIVGFQKDVYLRFHMQMFAWQNIWSKMTREGIAQMEAAQMKENMKMISQSPRESK